MTMMSNPSNMLHTTPSSLSSYPTYTPPPALPARNSPRATPATVTRRTFHDECEDVLRLVRQDAAMVMTTAGSGVETGKGGGMHVSRSTTREKYGAILDEVEHLNRLMHVTIEERDDIEEELRGRLMQMETTLRERDGELLYLRGVVEGMRVQMESLTTDSVNKSKKTNISSRSIHSNSNSNSNNIVSVAAVDSNGGGSFTSSASHVAKNALQWMKFLLRRCFSVDGGGDGEKVTHLIKLLNDLERCGVEESNAVANDDDDDINDAAAVRALCTQVSNSLVGVCLGGAKERLRVNKDAPELRSSTEHRAASAEEEKSILQKRVLQLEMERDALRQEVRTIADENVQLLQELKSRDKSPAEVQNALLTTERRQQATVIQELTEQIRQLEEERNSLHVKMTQQAESLKRHERVLDFLSHYERGVRVDGNSREGRGEGEEGGSDTREIMQRVTK